MVPRMTGALAALAVIAAIEAHAQAPRPPARKPLEAGTSSISGRVADDRGAPVAGADVTLSDGSRSADTVKTDANGVYRFDRIRAGQYTVQAQHAGYALLVLADFQSAPHLATTEVVPDQHRDDVNLVLPRAGRIRGRVVDREGRPVAGVSVGAGRMVRGRFMRSPLVFRVAPGSTKALQDGTSGPDGAYEIVGVAAGEFLVEANPGMAFRSQSATVEYQSTFHPDVSSAELAMPVSVEAGRVTSGIDIVMIGHALGTLRMRLAPEPQGLTDLQWNVVAFPGKQIRSVKIGADGLAQVPGLKEGRYAVWARARVGSDPMAAFQMLDFGIDSPELWLPLDATGRITGQLISARGGLPPVDGVRVETALMFEGERVDHLAIDTADVAADGRFTVEGQFGTRRVSVTGLPDGWQLREIVLGRQEVTQTGVDVSPGALVDIVIVLDRR